MSRKVTWSSNEPSFNHRRDKAQTMEKFLEILARRLFGGFFSHCWECEAHPGSLHSLYDHRAKAHTSDLSWVDFFAEAYEAATKEPEKHAELAHQDVEHLLPRKPPTLRPNADENPLLVASQEVLEFLFEKRDTQYHYAETLGPSADVYRCLWGGLCYQVCCTTDEKGVHIVNLHTPHYRSSLTMSVKAARRRRTAETRRSRTTESRGRHQMLETSGGSNTGETTRSGRGNQRGGGRMTFCKLC